MNGSLPSAAHLGSAALPMVEKAAALLPSNMYMYVYICDRLSVDIRTPHLHILFMYTQIMSIVKSEKVYALTIFFMLVK